MSEIETFSGFRTILADPPWSFSVRSDKGKGRSPENHYPTMTADDILKLPVSNISDKDCLLLLWVTDPNLKLGLKTMEAWGFEYKTVAFTWAKLCRKSNRPFVGMGYWTRANPEMCLLGTKGHPKRKGKDVQQLLIAPLREHSRKPDEQYNRIERLVDGPYVELFATHKRPSWVSVGNAIDGVDIRESLEAIARLKGTSVFPA